MVIHSIISPLERFQSISLFGLVPFEKFLVGTDGFGEWASLSLFRRMSKSVQRIWLGSVAYQVFSQIGYMSCWLALIHVNYTGVLEITSNSKQASKRQGTMKPDPQFLLVGDRLLSSLPICLSPSHLSEADSSSQLLSAIPLSATLRMDLHRSLLTIVNYLYSKRRPESPLALADLSFDVLRQCIPALLHELRAPLSPSLPPLPTLPTVILSSYTLVWNTRDQNMMRNLLTSPDVNLDVLLYVISCGHPCDKNT